MFRWILILSILIAVINGLSVNRSSEVSSDENLDVLINDFDTLDINDDGADDAEEEEEYDEEYLYNKVNNLSPRAGVCQINIRDLPQRKPLLRDPRTQRILLPDQAGSSVITLRAGEHMEIDCPGSNIVVDSLTIGDIADAECVSGNRLRIQNRVVEFDTVVCSRRVASVARYTNRRCWNNRGQEVEVGFVFTDGHFIQEMTTCFDPDTRDVYYSLFDMLHQIGDQNTGGTRPAWTEGTFYNLGVRLDVLYPNAAQRTTLNRLVGLPDDSIKYVQPTGSYYLARGHLIARADYMYYAQQEATFHYINSVPQWQTFNGFNWAYFETNVRQYAARRGLDLVVMTGGYNISTLPHEQTGRPVELYLFADGNARAMPVPAQFWKVVYSPSTQAGVAVLGLNNPFIDDVQNERICPDIADQLTWLSFDRTLIHRGYMYACTIADLRRVIPEIPDYRVTRILN